MFKYFFVKNLTINTKEKEYDLFQHKLLRQTT